MTSSKNTPAGTKIFFTSETSNWSANENHMSNTSTTLKAMDACSIARLVSISASSLTWPLQQELKAHTELFDLVRRIGQPADRFVKSYIAARSEVNCFGLSVAKRTQKIKAAKIKARAAYVELMNHAVANF